MKLFSSPTKTVVMAKDSILGQSWETAIFTMESYGYGELMKFEK